MWRVVWLQTALDDLASIWISADSTTRNDISESANDIESTLREKGDECGESRQDNERIAFAEPIAIQFEVDPSGATVRIFHVWSIRRES